MWSEGYFSFLFLFDLFFDMFILRFHLIWITKIRIIRICFSKSILNSCEVVASKISCEDGIDQREKETDERQQDQHHNCPLVDHITFEFIIRVVECEDQQWFYEHDSHGYAENDVHSQVVWQIVKTDAVVDELTVVIESISTSLTVETVFGLLFYVFLANRTVFSFSFIVCLIVENKRVNWTAAG